MKNRITLYRMTAAALLMALVFVLGMTPLGLIPLGFINVTILVSNLSQIDINLRKICP